MTLLPRRIKIRGDTFFRRFNATLNVLTQLVTAGEPEAQRDPRVRLKDATRVSQAETRERESGVTYVVMEGLCLAGVLARLPSVWSRTIQIPEHAETE